MLITIIEKGLYIKISLANAGLNKVNQISLQLDIW